MGVEDFDTEDPNSDENPRQAFDVRPAQRWIMNRVLELGWTTERFGTFDSRINEERPYRRIDNGKPERMGKKYAWIGLHEFLGYLSDHVDYRGDDWQGKSSAYNGPWQFGLRDIDPSMLAQETCRTEKSETVQCWWQPVEFYFEEQAPEDYGIWVKDSECQIEPLELIQLRDAKGKEWLSLQGFYDWTESAPLGEDPHEISRRNLWIMIKGYVVKSDEASSFIQWINDRSLWGRWMPESDDVHTVLLGEYPWAEAFDSHRATDPWTTGWRSPLPHPIMVTAMGYLGEQGYDCSIDDTIHAMLPSYGLIESMDLRWSQVGFSYLDSDGKTVTCDPSEREKGPGALLIREDALTSFLTKNNYDLIWTVLGERTVLHPLFRSSDQIHHGHTILQSTYRLHNGEVTGGPLSEEFKTHS